MNQPKRKYDSMVARIAGNILSGVMRQPWPDDGFIGWTQPDVEQAVALARAIVAEVERTEPKED